MEKGWLELESDPGLFTLLLEDMGAKGVQVEEIYDLQSLIQGTVYGFIFLFKWIEERRSRRKVIHQEENLVKDENILNDIYFAQQIIANSCATHALLSVLLNCDRIELGDTLTKLKQFCRGMNPEDKGFAIGNMPELAEAHNSHARRELCQLPEKQQGGIASKTMEAFHFVSYVPLHGRLYELDGLKPYPIDHGPWNENEEWTEKFRRVITERLGMATGGEPYHDIRFNLMAVVPDMREIYEQQLKTLNADRQTVLETLQKMVDVTDDGFKLRQEAWATDRPKYERLTRRRSRAAREVKSDIYDILSAEKGVSPPIDTTPTKLTSLPVSPQTSHSALDNHNYAKSPILGCKAQSSTNDVDSDIEIIDDIKSPALSGEKTVASVPDFSRPLSVNTKCPDLTSPLLSGETTDTASESGSAFNSPARDIFGINAGRNISAGHSSSRAILTQGNKDIKNEESKVDTMSVSVGCSSSEQKPVSAVLDGLQKDGYVAESTTGNDSGETPKELLARLRKVDQEITICENNLKDEVEKRNKYKIDDCRRTHNYDPFIFTFLTMLAEQGHLSGLVEQHTLIKRKQNVNGGNVNAKKGKLSRKARKYKDRRKKK